MTEKTPAAPPRRDSSRRRPPAPPRQAPCRADGGRAQTTSLRFQSTWPAKDIFHEYALDFAKKVNDMTGGELKIEVLPAGAVVPAFGLLDAVSKGTLDGGHGVLVLPLRQAERARAVGLGPGLRHGRQHAARLAQVRRRQGAARQALQASIGANVVSFPYGPMPTQPLGWFKKPITKVEDFKGLKFRTVGLSIDVFTAHGRGGQRAARRRDRAGDGPRPARRGRVQQRDLGQRARLPRRLEGLHAAELPPERRAVRDHVQQDQVRRAAGQDEGDHRQRGRGRLADMVWKAIDRYSKDYIELQTRTGVKFYKTPDAVLQQQLEAYDEVARRRRPRTTRCSRRSIASQRAFAERAVKWDLDTNVDRRMAYNHYFGKPAAPRRQEGLTQQAGPH